MTNPTDDDGGGGEDPRPDSFLADLNDDQIAPLGTVRVHDGGRFTVESPERHRYGIDPDDVVHANVITDEGTEVFLSYLVVTSGNQIRIPHRIRTLFNVSDGDLLDVDLIQTGMSMPSEE